MYGEGCSFEYGTNFMPHTVFGEGCEFLGNMCEYCDPYITFTGPVVIGKNSTFYYCIFIETTPSSVIGQPYIDLGSNTFDGADQSRPNNTEGGGNHLDSENCPQALGPNGRVEAPCVHDT